MAINQWIKNQFWFLTRFVSYLVINVLWFILLLPFCILRKWIGAPLFGYIFLVYPGERNHVKGYVPQRCRSIAPLISVIGMIRKGKQGISRGLVVAIPWTIEETQGGVILEMIACRVTKLAESIGAKAIALAGRMPGIYMQSSYSSLLAKPIVAGDKGTVYSITLCIRQSMEASGMKASESTVGILGYGFIGSRLANNLRYEEVKKIIAVDLRIKRERNYDDKLLISVNPAKLAECDLVVVLTAEGKQAEDAIEWLKPGVIVLDDTHPQLPQDLSSLIKKKGGKVIKAVLSLDGVIFLPRLPNWKATWLPGCCIEGLVSASKGFATTQQEFNRLAQEFNFRVLETQNIHEL